jgi:hypothetical protein
MSFPILVKPAAEGPSPAVPSAAQAEMTPPPYPSPPTIVQMIVYGPGAPTVIEGTATTTSAGEVTLHLPIMTPPAGGTTVQIILYGPGQPTVLEGMTTPPAGDGTFEVIPIP